MNRLSALAFLQSRLHKFIRALDESGAQARPDPGVIDALRQAATIEGRHQLLGSADLLREWLGQVDRAGVTDDVQFMNALAVGACSQGQLEMFLRLLDESGARGRPDPRVCNALRRITTNEGMQGIFESTDKLQELIRVMDQLGADAQIMNRLAGLAWVDGHLDIFLKAVEESGTAGVPDPRFIGALRRISAPEGVIGLLESSDDLRDWLRQINQVGLPMGGIVNALATGAFELGRLDAFLDALEASGTKDKLDPQVIDTLRSRSEAGPSSGSRKRPFDQISECRRITCKPLGRYSTGCPLPRSARCARTQIPTR
jgi:hypothetical protein